MNYIVSITSQGQLTIPKGIRDDFDITQASKAVIKKVGSKIVVEPKGGFWSLGGSLKSEIKLTDKQLREARLSFEKEWAKKDD
ncbi:AbrB/MazE/SpoVT family DNA-binding domain-containing protein [Patescibacteria group bacterium]|nr:AbrB/MazE/SpoVT family DNA-binding domain-containing protein [Patescibacteria group bacterium]